MDPRPAGNEGGSVGGTQVRVKKLPIADCRLPIGVKVARRSKSAV